MACRSKARARAHVAPRMSCKAAAAPRTSSPNCRATWGLVGGVGEGLGEGKSDSEREDKGLGSRVGHEVVGALDPESLDRLGIGGGAGELG